MSDRRHDTHLKKTLGPAMLWGLGVGYVISGEYFGWNLGLPVGGTYGMLLAFVVITLMYITFVFSYTELACAIPRAGGVFVYGVRGLGLGWGYLGGIAQVVEFVFAPPAIAVAIGAYVSQVLPASAQNTAVAPATWIALVAYTLFTALNIWGVRQAAIFEFVVTLLAVGELLLFTVVTAPHFKLEAFHRNAWPNGLGGAVAAIPFAIWFYLAIEGVANAAEESREPRRDVPRGFGTAIATLVVLACCAFFCSVGVGGWERVVYPPDQLAETATGVTPIAGAETSDSPLPLALGQVVEKTSPLYRLLIGIGLLGLIASFNGIILVAGRALFETGRVGFLPHFIGRTHPATKTPVNALLLNFVVGMVAILYFDTGKLITMSVFGAVTLYLVSMAALIALRRREPELPRPYRAPCYPWFPITTLVIASFSLLTMAYYNLDTTTRDSLANSITIWYALFLILAFAYFYLVVKQRLTAEDIAHFKRLD